MGAHIFIIFQLPADPPPSLPNNAQSKFLLHSPPVHPLTTFPSPVFPGGFLPTLTFLTSSLTTGSKGRLVVESVANIGPHYSRTLREWRQRFAQKFEAVIVPALQKEYRERSAKEGKQGHGGKQATLSRDEIEVFRRKWICELDLIFFCYKKLSLFVVVRLLLLLRSWFHDEDARRYIPRSLSYR